MAKEEKKKGVAASEEKVDGKGGAAAEVINSNMLTDKAIKAALEEIEKEKDEKKKDQAKRALCIATYINRKIRLQLQQRRREDDITKEKLDASKKLTERLIGFECEIKDGVLVPTDKKVDDKDRLTPNQLEDETRKLNEEFDNKFRESTKTYDEAVRELRDSFEGRYRYYLNEW